MNNQDLQKIAEKVIKKADIKQEDKEKFGSVIIILSVISILLTLIRVMQECNKSKIKLFSRDQKYEYFGSQIKEVTIRRSWFTKMTTKKVIRRELSREDYHNYGASLMNAILDTGENLKDDEIKTLVEAANV
jgi:hypothetical protein